LTIEGSIDVLAKEFNHGYCLGLGSVLGLGLWINIIRPELHNNVYFTWAWFSFRDRLEMSVEYNWNHLVYNLEMKRVRHIIFITKSKLCAWFVHEKLMHLWITCTIGLLNLYWWILARVGCKNARTCECIFTANECQYSPIYVLSYS
jgi:hypothetical protein